MRTIARQAINPIFLNDNTITVIPGQQCLSINLLTRPSNCKIGSRINVQELSNIDPANDLNIECPLKHSRKQLPKLILANGKTTGNDR